MLRVHGMRQRYHHEEVGWNSRLDTLQAAILLVKLAHIGRWNEERRRLAAGYDRLFRERGLAEAAAPPAPEGGTADAPAHVPALSRDRVLLPGEAAGARHCWHQYVLRAPRRDELRAFLTSRRIGTEIYYPLPLHLQPALAGLGYRAGDFPLAERAAREVLALPLFPGLRAEEQELVVDTIAEFLR
jgi:dTDP-4-amino-4,6-dideoxygalactose transaminase